MASTVRAGRVYIYRPVGLDMFDPKSSATPGQRVEVRNLPGCPRANTMGHCHVIDHATGEFLGLVLTASLTPEKSPHSYTVPVCACCGRVECSLDTKGRHS